MAIVDGHVANGPNLDPEQVESEYEVFAGLGGVTLERILAEPQAVYEKYHNPETLEVEVTSTLTREDYRKVTPKQEWEKFEEYCEAHRGKKMYFFNATANGGGVAIMRGPMIHLMREMGIDARWFALMEDEQAALVTKGKFHNVMQDVAGEDVRLTEKDIYVYSEWIARNEVILEKPLSEADVICIDDWQPSGLIPYIKGEADVPGLNPNAPILFRDHIHTRGDLMVQEGTPQYDTWQFLWHRNRIKDADAFITHPKPEFVPPNVPDQKVVYMPAAIDILDDLNRELSDEEIDAGLEFVNAELAKNGNQLPIDHGRQYIVLIARFDESKGMPQALEAYAEHRRQMLEMGCAPEDLPQLVIAGNGSVDDPSGKPMLEKMMKLRTELYEEFEDDIKIVRLPANDIAINALLKNADIALQPSIAEGFESRVADAIWQGVPVIGSNRGGIPLQIKEGESGFVIDPYDTKQWGRRITELMTDPDKYTYMCRMAKLHAETTNYQFTTIPNIINWLHLSKTMLDPASRSNFYGGQEWVRDMVFPRGNDQELEQLAA